MRAANHDTYIGSVFLIFCGIAWWLISELPTGAGYEKTIGPEFFPGVMTAVIAMLSAVLVVRSLWRGETAAGAEPAVATGRILLRIVLFLLLLLGYVFLYEPLGFLVSSMLVLPSGMLMLGEKRWGLILVFPAVIIGLVYVAFTKLIMVPLPEFSLHLFVA